MQFGILSTTTMRHYLFSTTNNGIHSLELTPAFTRENLVKYNQRLNSYSGGRAYEFTDLGKIPIGKLSLSGFNWV